MFESKAAPAAKYPLHHRLQDNADLGRHVGIFIGWLKSRGWEICESGSGGDPSYEEWRPLNMTIEQIVINHYLGIDPKALAAEKDAMYDEMQRMRAAE